MFNGAYKNRKGNANSILGIFLTLSWSIKNVCYEKNLKLTGGKLEVK